jgi:hypothetical protein
MNNDSVSTNFQGVEENVFLIMTKTRKTAASYIIALMYEEILGKTC